MNINHNQNIQPIFQVKPKDMDDGCYITVVKDISEDKITSSPPPDDFICPLTLEVMQVPLMSRWGHNFESEALLQWIETKRICPLTRNEMGLQDVVVNRPLQARIQYWRHQNSKSPHYEKDSPRKERIFLAKLESETQVMSIVRKTMMRRAKENENKGNDSNRAYTSDQRVPATGSSSRRRSQRSVRRAAAA